MKIRPVRAARGMVGAGNPLASAEGLAVLRAGGNAFDAAVAAAAVLAVVSPHECGLGGDLLAVVHHAKTGRTMALNASGRSPAAATVDRYPDGMPLTGPRSVSVPGMVGGWAALLEGFGTRPFGKLLSGAIQYAEQGFPAYDDLIENAAQRTASIFANPHCKALFFPQDRPLREGEMIRQAAAGRTLRAIAADGAAGFYRGPVAESMAHTVQAGGGLLCAADLAAFEPLWQDVMDAHFGEHRICTMPPSSWATAMLLQMSLMEAEGIAPLSQEAEFVLQGIRTRRQAYAMLEGCIADPDVAGEQARTVLNQHRAGLATGACPPAQPEGLHGMDTSNVVVIDNEGNAVSLLQSVFVPFGSGVLDPETGALFNNRMRGFGTRPDDPNCVAPGKRPAQTLTPVLVLKNGQAWLACGTPGGPGQTGTMAQFAARLLFHGQSMQDAIGAPRWSKTLVGDFILEDTASPALQQAVLKDEPEVKVAPWGSINFGSIVAIMRDGEGLVGCADNRRNAAMHGF
ncbi:gamma-glutamyltransferase family protein [Lacisediminimonas profundi]|uniref:gamma-glutamyltransferase family protein n=1 Tax=Lacisediminimonas profundi TaxID=2603856 RepID=UPI00124BC11F|nr:gamma-glutamyltransferase [Lacisediminimonas profundi]